jgi:RHS repeat-associated protein
VSQGHIRLSVNPGLAHLGARYYNPATGTWTQPDPDAQSLATDPTQADAYTFAGDDPINDVDASGRESVADAGKEASKECVKGAVAGGILGSESGPFDLVPASGGCLTGMAITWGSFAASKVSKTAGWLVKAGATTVDEVKSAWDWATSWVP